MNIDSKALEANVANCLKRWREIITTTSSTNRDLAISAVNDLYRAMQLDKPAVILWCDSPFQMQVVPPAVRLILESERWAELLGETKSFACPGNTQWQAKWEEWLRTNDAFIGARVEEIIARARTYRRVDQSVRQAAIECVKRHLHDIIAIGKLGPEGMGTTFGGVSEPKKKVIFASYQMNFIKTLLELYGRVERSAGLKFTFSALSIGGMFLGVWDTRMLTQFAPAIEKILMPNVHNPEVLKEVQKIKPKCAELERIATQMHLWFFTLFSRERPAVRPIRPEPGQRLDLTRLMQESIQAMNQANEEMQADRENELKNPDLTNRLTIWLPYAAIWLPFALSCRYVEPNFFGAADDLIDCWAYLSHAAAGYYFCPKICFVCSKPISIQTNEAGRPHNPSGPAVVWADGLKIYSWRGVVINSDLIEDKGSITWQRINQERNAEIRRVMMDIYGESRYLMDSGAVAVDENEHGILYRLDIPNDEPLVMVRVRNSTPEPDGTYRFYFLRVPPTMQRVKQAIAWTFGLEEHEYNPEKAS
jgi:hypothetical protein